MVVLRFLLENGIGQNITAGALTVALGYLWSKTKFWPLNVLRDLHESHKQLHVKLDRLQDRQTQLHADHQKKLHEFHHELREKFDALAGGTGSDASNV